MALRKGWMPACAGMTALSRHLPHQVKTPLTHIHQVQSAINIEPHHENRSTPR
ncbi:MAG: hypothetical protein JSR53_05015 [Proteobacteria bacterium]|nr:hypothetical protein [Pseudomonadota bacterium]